MRLVNFIEELNLDRVHLTPELRYQIAHETEYESGVWIEAARIFLRGIGARHQVPAQVVFTMWGLIDYYNQHEELTPRQQGYLTNNLINYWHNIGCEMRATIYY